MSRTDHSKIFLERMGLRERWTYIADDFFVVWFRYRKGGTFDTSLSFSCSPILQVHVCNI